MRALVYSKVEAKWIASSKQFVQRKKEPVREPTPEEIRERALNTLRRRGVPVWARQIIEEVATRTGVSLELIAGHRKFRRVVHARNEAIYLMKVYRPALSTPQIAAWFNRDHTSILHSIAAHSELTGAPKLCGYNLQRARKRNAAFNAWKREQARKAA